MIWLPLLVSVVIVATGLCAGGWCCGDETEMIGSRVPADKLVQPMKKKRKHTGVATGRRLGDRYTLGRGTNAGGGMRTLGRVRGTRVRVDGYTWGGMRMLGRDTNRRDTNAGEECKREGLMRMANVGEGTYDCANPGEQLDIHAGPGQQLGWLTLGDCAGKGLGVGAGLC